MTILPTPLIPENTKSFHNSLGLTHLIGTPTLKPYMHGFFLSLKLYDAARLIANPFAYDEHRERLVRDKLEKLSESRIRSRGSGDVKVNKALAERIRKMEKKREKKASAEEEKGEGAVSLLNDPRFAQVFENPDFEIDTESREYGLLNPSGVSVSYLYYPISLPNLKYFE